MKKTVSANFSDAMEQLKSLAEEFPEKLFMVMDKSVKNGISLITVKNDSVIYDDRGVRYIYEVNPNIVRMVMDDI